MTIEVPLWLIWIVLHIIITVFLAYKFKKDSEDIIGGSITLFLVIGFATFIYHCREADKQNEKKAIQVFTASYNALPDEWKPIFDIMRNMKNSKLDSNEIAAFLDQSIKTNLNLPKLSNDHYLFMRQHFSSESLTPIFKYCVDYTAYKEKK